MKQLFDFRFAPLTFSYGFIGAPFSRVSEAARSWFFSLDREGYNFEFIVGKLEQFLTLLLPVVTPRTKELYVSTDSDWTAYFDNSTNGGDPESRVGFLCQLLACQGVIVSCSPDIVKQGRQLNYGQVRFTLFANHSTRFLNYARSVAVTNDDGWRFDVSGTVQEFEETERYSATQVCDRFTDEMLERYGRALGLEVFEPKFFGEQAMLVKTARPPVDAEHTMTLQEVQREIGLAPD